MTRLLSVFLWIAVAIPAVSQEKKLTGIVIDRNTGNPIAGVHVKVSGTMPTTTPHYFRHVSNETTTDPEGRFEVDIRHLTELSLELRHIGFRAISKEIDTTSQKNTYVMSRETVRLADLWLSDFPKREDRIVVGPDAAYLDSREPKYTWKAHYWAGWKSFQIHLGNVLYKQFRHLKDSIDIEFTIDTLGYLTNIYSPDSTLGKSLIKRLEKLPTWYPAAQSNKAVPQNFLVRVFSKNFDAIEFYRYLRAHLTIPPKALREQVSGRQRIRFRVDKNGLISDIKHWEGQEEVTEELQQVISQTPGKVARSLFEISKGRQISVVVNFRLTDVEVEVDMPFVVGDIYRVREVLITPSVSTQNKKNHR